MNQCKDCSFFMEHKSPHANWGECTNPKLQENPYSTDGTEHDRLDYPYNEGASFQPGKYFGCIHWMKKAP